MLPPLITGSVGADFLDLPRRALQQIVQGFVVTGIVCGGHGADDFEHRFVRAEVEFALGPTLRNYLPPDFTFASVEDVDT